MTTTLTLHWWMVPLALVSVALFVWWRGSNAPGMFGGYEEFFIGAGLIVAAIAVTVTKLVFG